LQPPLASASLRWCVKFSQASGANLRDIENSQKVDRQNIFYTLDNSIALSKPPSEKLFNKKAPQLMLWRFFFFYDAMAPDFAKPRLVGADTTTQAQPTPNGGSLAVDE
jgi:hypothetical protein